MMCGVSNRSIYARARPRRNGGPNNLRGAPQTTFVCNVHGTVVMSAWKRPYRTCAELIFPGMLQTVIVCPGKPGRLSNAWRAQMLAIRIPKIHRAKAWRAMIELAPIRLVSKEPIYEVFPAHLDLLTAC